MKWNLCAVVAVVLSLGAGPADDAVFQEIKSLQDKLNVAFKENDEAAIRALVTDNHIAVTPFYERPFTLTEQIKALGDSKLTKYSTGAMNFNRLADDVVHVTFPVTLQGTYRGKPVPSKVFASVLWVRHNGKWQEYFYQETSLGTR